MTNTGGRTVFSVSQVNEYVKYLLEDSPVLDGIYVRGEISNLTAYHASGHLYFSLKDESGVLRCVMFRSAAARLKFRPENGMRVIICGRVSVYVRDGQYQLYADSMEPDGVGALALAFEQLKNKLAAEGLFDDSRKKPLPLYPEVIGVITSPTGAAVRDIINIQYRRWPCAKVILFPTLVQGENAPRQLCSGIRYFNSVKTPDVIIIGRGGGSLEELWAFNDETLARTVAASEIPVISAVGHETDFTICDFAADCRAPTPSAAAELAVPDAGELSSRVDAYASALFRGITKHISEERQYLSMLAGKRVLSSPDSFLRERRLFLDTLSARMDVSLTHHTSAAKTRLDALESALLRGMEHRLSDAKQALAAAGTRLEAYNPLSVLTRGYSAVFDENGTSVHSVSQLQENDTVTMRFSDGCAAARILEIQTSPQKSSI